MSNVEMRLARLEACEEIRTTIYSYAAAGDRHNDPEVVARLFTEDGTFEAVGMAKFEGRDEVICGLAEVGRTVVLWSFHHPGGPIIELNADSTTARAFWWIWCPTEFAGDPANAPIWGAGNYNADLVKSEGCWKFSRLVFDTKLKTPFEGPWTRIDRDFEWLV